MQIGWHERPHQNQGDYQKVVWRDVETYLLRLAKVAEHDVIPLQIVKATLIWKTVLNVRYISTSRETIQGCLVYKAVRRYLIVLIINRISIPIYYFAGTTPAKYKLSQIGSPVYQEVVGER